MLFFLRGGSISWFWFTFWGPFTSSRRAHGLGRSEGEGGISHRRISLLEKPYNLISYNLSSTFSKFAHVLVLIHNLLQNLSTPGYEIQIYSGRYQNKRSIFFYCTTTKTNPSIDGES